MATAVQIYTCFIQFVNSSGQFTGICVLCPGSAHKVSEDIYFLTGYLQRVHTRYVEMVDSSIPDIIENATLHRNIEFVKIQN